MLRRRWCLENRRLVDGETFSGKCAAATGKHSPAVAAARGGHRGDGETFHNLRNVATWLRRAFSRMLPRRRRGRFSGTADGETFPWEEPRRVRRLEFRKNVSPSLRVAMLPRRARALRGNIPKMLPRRAGVEPVRPVETFSELRCHVSAAVARATGKHFRPFSGNVAPSAWSR
eukprot:gene17893-biopygen417